MNLDNIGLILEGGGMRGAYTAGALDFFLDAGLEFPRIYAVSAGACHACSYLSKQRGRAMDVVLTMLRDWRYGSVRSLLFTGDFFEKQYVYEEVPKSILRFDYDTFRENPHKLISVVTNVRTGQAEYRMMNDLEADKEWLRASASLPMISSLVMIDGNPYLDGGVADSIPLARSIADGYKKNIVILTRHRGYRKPPSNSLAMRLFYRKYPEFLRACANRHNNYNESLELSWAEESAGRALVLHPKDEIKIGRLEKNPVKLRELYETGYREAEMHFRENQDFFRESIPETGAVL